MLLPLTMEPDIMSSANMTAEQRVWRELYFWIPPISFLFGLVGNSLCLAVTCHSQTLMSVSTKTYTTGILLMCQIFLVSTLIAWIPSSLVDYFDRSNITFLQEALLKDIGCQLIAYFRSASFFILAWLLVAQTGERYVTLARPMKETKNPRCVAITITFVITLIGFGFEAGKFFGIESFLANRTMAIEAPGCYYNQLGQVLKLVDLLLVYLLSPVFVFVLALCLSCMVNIHNHYRRKWQYRKQENQPPIKVGEPKAELPLVMAFAYSPGLIAYFVWSVVYLISIIWGQDDAIDKVAAYVERIAQLLMIIISGVNIFFFIFAGRPYRNALKFVCCRCRYRESKGYERNDLNDSRRGSSSSSLPNGDKKNKHTKDVKEQKSLQNNGHSHKGFVEDRDTENTKL